MFKYFNYLLALIFLILVSACVEKQDNLVVDSLVLSVDSITAPEKDSIIAGKIKKYGEPLKEMMNSVLVYSEVSMSRGTPEGLLNNFVADLTFSIGAELYDTNDQKPIDFCLLNYGGLRTSIPEGAITRSRVFELMPFENELIVVTLTPEKTYELFRYLAESDKGMPVSGIKLGIKDEYPEVILIGGKPFDKNRNYKVLTSDFLAKGGDNMVFFLQPINYELVGIKVRDAIIKHMENVHEKGQKISSSLDERIFYLH